MSEYYVEDTERLPFAIGVKLLERHVPHFVAVWLTCWWRFRRRTGFPVKPLYASRWDPGVKWKCREDMPAQALSRWAPLVEHFEDLAFTVCGWLKTDTIGSKDEASVYLLNESGNTLATLLWLRIGVDEQTQVTLTSWWNDGTEIMTAALPKVQQLLAGVISPDYVKLVCASAGTSPAKLCRIHSERTELLEAIHLTCESLKVHYQQQRIRLFQHARDTGILRPLSEREVAFLRD